MKADRDEANRLEALRAEARYRRERADLYRARIQTGRAENLQKLRDLERAAEQTAERLAAAERAAKTPPGRSGS